MGRTSQAWNEHQKTVKSHQTRKGHPRQTLAKIWGASLEIQKVSVKLQHDYTGFNNNKAFQWKQCSGSLGICLNQVQNFLFWENQQAIWDQKISSYLVSEYHIHVLILSNNSRDFWGIAAVSYLQPINIISFCCSVTQWRTKMLLSPEWRSSWWQILLQEKGVFSDSGEMGVEKWWKKCQGCWMRLTFLKLESSSV